MTLQEHDCVPLLATLPSIRHRFQLISNKGLLELDLKFQMSTVIVMSFRDIPKTLTCEGQVFTAFAQVSF